MRPDAAAPADADALDVERAESEVERHVGLVDDAETSLYEVTSIGRRRVRSGDKRVATGLLSAVAAATW